MPDTKLKENDYSLLGALTWLLDDMIDAGEGVHNEQTGKYFDSVEHAIKVRDMNTPKKDVLMNTKYFLVDGVVFTVDKYQTGYFLVSIGIFSGSYPPSPDRTHESVLQVFVDKVVKEEILPFHLINTPNHNIVECDKNGRA